MNLCMLQRNKLNEVNSLLKISRISKPLGCEVLIVEDFCPPHAGVR